MKVLVGENLIKTQSEGLASMVLNDGILVGYKEGRVLFHEQDAGL